MNAYSNEAQQNNIRFPNTIYLDISAEIKEFFTVIKPGQNITQNDRLFLEEVLSVICQALSNFTQFNEALQIGLRYFLTVNCVYKMTDNNSREILSAACFNIANQIFIKLACHRAYVSGFFPYLFHSVQNDDTLILVHGKELMSDWYRKPALNLDQNLDESY